MLKVLPWWLPVAAAVTLISLALILTFQLYELKVAFPTGGGIELRPSVRVDSPQLSQPKEVLSGATTAEVEKSGISAATP